MQSVMSDCNESPPVYVRLKMFVAETRVQIQAKIPKCPQTLNFKVF